MKPLPIHPISLPTGFPIGDIHTYLIRQDPVTLVDTGLNLPVARQGLVDGLQAHGLGLHDIRRVLITHAHFDHSGLAGWIQAESGAEVWAHPDEVGKLEGPEWWMAARERSLREAGVTQEARETIDSLWNRGRLLHTSIGQWNPLHAGQEFSFESGSLTPVHLPGHALGHVGFLDPASGCLIGGDHILDGVTPNPILEPVREGHPAAPPHAPHRALTLGQFLDALDRLNRMDVKQVLPGHGPAITDHRAVAAGYLRRHEARLSHLAGQLGAGVSAFELTRRIYPSVRGYDVFLALSEVLAHLDLLVVRGLAGLERAGETALYRAVS